MTTLGQMGVTAVQGAVPSLDGTHPAGTSANPIYVAQSSIRSHRGPWVQTNIGASQTGVQIGYGANGASQLDAGMLRDGFLTGIVATFTVAPAGSTLTISVFKNGTLLDATAVLSVTTGSSLVRRATFTAGTAALGFVAGDKIGVAITTDGSWTATTSDVAVDLELQLS